MSWLNIISYCGTFVFAITGALKARNHKMDIFGAAILAFTTACLIGGTIFVLMLKLDVRNEISIILCVILIVVIRILSKTNRIHLPVFK